MTPSPDLYKFFLAYRAWVDAGAPKNEPFAQVNELCWNSQIFNCTESLKNLLQKEFGDRWEFPFDDTSEIYYDTNEQHLNSKRLAFVDEMIARGREEYGENQ